MTLDESIRTVAVHGSNFHSDDVFAVAALKMIYPGIEVIRTRDEKLLNSADIRIDVGFEYNHENRTYDHHQKGGAGVRDNGIPYSSFGLIWKHYGTEICGSDEIVSRLDEKIVQKIDGVDAGYFKPRKDDNDRDFYLSSAISYLNPGWMDNNPDYDSAFDKAVDFAQDVLKGMIAVEKGRIVARDIVREAISRQEGKPYIILDRKCPWEETTINESDALYVISGYETKWMVSAVPVVHGQYDLRKPFPEDWAGASPEELQKISGVSDAMFCHTNRFIASAKSLEGAIKLAEISSESE